MKTNKQVISILLGMVLCSTALLGGCSSSSDASSKGELLSEYAAIPEVNAYYDSAAASIEDLTNAWEKGDKTRMSTAKKRLDTLCDGFINSKEIPEEMEDMHEHMIKVAESEKEYAKALLENDRKSIEASLDEILEETEQAKKALPTE